MKLVSTPHFERQLDKLPDAAVKRVYNKLNDLIKNAVNVDVRKLEGKNEYRLRFGSYRVIFEYQTISGGLVILLKNVEHRKDIYKKRK